MYDGSIIRNLKGVAVLPVQLRAGQQTRQARQTVNGGARSKLQGVHAAFAIRRLHAAQRGRPADEDSTGRATR